MFDIVNDDDLSSLAAEFVLGTLEPDERVRANGLLDADHGFRGLVRVWERRLGELHLMVEPVEPDGKVWERIRDKAGLLPPQVVAPPPAPQPEPLPEPLPEQLFEPLLAPLPEPPLAIVPDPPPADQPGQTVHAERLAELVHEVEKLAEAVNADAAVTGQASEPTLVSPDVAVAVASPDLTPEETLTVRKEAETPVRQRPPHVGRWRAAALVMTIVAIGLSGLIAAWRFVPDRLPLPLQPTTVLNIHTPEAPQPAERTPPPSGTGFEE